MVEVAAAVHPLVSFISRWDGMSGEGVSEGSDEKAKISFDSAHGLKNTVARTKIGRWQNGYWF